MIVQGASTLLIIFKAFSRCVRNGIALLLCIQPWAGAQTEHGTVNIVLANQRGLVIATDSRLSSQGRARGEGQKLFQIDDHTFASIAGWFSSLGPTIDGRHYPAFMAIPYVFRAMSEAHFNPSDNVETKFARYLGAMQFNLQWIQEISDFVGDSQDKVCELTLTSFEGGRYRIISARLTLTGTAPHTFTVSDRQIIEVSSFDYLVRGMTDVALPILQGTAGRPKSGAVLSYFQEALSDHVVAAMSISDLMQVARRLVLMTAERHVQEVGGVTQIGIIEAGKANLIDPFNSEDTLLPPPELNFFVNASFKGAGNSKLDQGIRQPTGAKFPASVLIRAHFTSVKQQLDNLLVFGSSFEGVSLHYSGSPVAFFDKSNELLGCQLVLDADVQRSSSFVAQFERDFPRVPIITAPK